MAMTDGNPVFLDTNVLVYASIAESPFHLAALSAVQTRYHAGDELWISRQVLREYLATLTRPQVFTPPIPISTLTSEIRLFESGFRIAEDGPKVTDVLLTLLGQVTIGGRQIHDANIVATMLAHGIHRLLTHNTADFARFSQFITALPLGAGP